MHNYLRGLGDFNIGFNTDSGFSFGTGSTPDAGMQFSMPDPSDYAVEWNSDDSFFENVAVFGGTAISYAYDTAADTVDQLWQPVEDAGGVVEFAKDSAMDYVKSRAADYAESKINAEINRHRPGSSGAPPSESTARGSEPSTAAGVGVSVADRFARQSELLAESNGLDARTVMDAAIEIAAAFTVDDVRSASAGFDKSMLEAVMRIAANAVKVGVIPYRPLGDGWQDVRGFSYSKIFLLLEDKINSAGVFAPARIKKTAQAQSLYEPPSKASGLLPLLSIGALLWMSR